MEVIKKLAPKYWLGYYVVYALSMIILTARYGHLITEGTDAEQIFVAAAIFGVSTGVALTSAITAEGVGYLILLIPNRIREIKEEGRKEGRAEMQAEVFAAGIEKGRAEERAEAEKRKEGRAEAQVERREEGLDGDERSLATGMRVGRQVGIAEERERLANVFARYDSGEITLDELRATLSGRLNGDNGAD